MKSRRDLGSPWGLRVYFEPDEFEAMMAEAIFRAGPEVFHEGQGVDVDLVLMKVYGLEADYVRLPNGVLGRTLFRNDGEAQIEVSRELADEAESDRLARRRLRSTLAHEGGHVACHRHLFLEDTETLRLFEDDVAQPEKPAILCRDPSGWSGAYQGEWWEFQANQCMARLLLPKRILVPRVTKLLQELGVDGFAGAQREGVDEEFIRVLSDAFDVSWQAMIFRLQGLGFVPQVDDLAQGRIAF